MTSPGITLLVQLPDEDKLRRLLDAQPLREVAREPGCFFYVIADGRSERVLAPEDAP